MGTTYIFHDTTRKGVQLRVNRFAAQCKVKFQRRYTIDMPYIAKAGNWCQWVNVCGERSAAVDRLYKSIYEENSK